MKKSTPENESEKFDRKGFRIVVYVKLRVWKKKGKRFTIFLSNGLRV